MYWGNCKARVNSKIKLSYLLLFDVVGPVTLATATEKSDRLQRCLSWVQDCKRAVNELRIEVKAAISHREKCCMVLSAAMAACLALESVSKAAARPFWLDCLRLALIMSKDINCA